MVDGMAVRATEAWVEGPDCAGLRSFSPASNRTDWCHWCWLRSTHGCRRSSVGRSPSRTYSKSDRWGTRASAQTVCGSPYTVSHLDRQEDAADSDVYVMAMTGDRAAVNMTISATPGTSPPLDETPTWSLCPVDAPPVA